MTERKKLAARNIACKHKKQHKSAIIAIGFHVCKFIFRNVYKKEVPFLYLNDNFIALFPVATNQNVNRIEYIITCLRNMTFQKCQVYFEPCAQTLLDAVACN